MIIMEWISMVILHWLMPHLLVARPSLPLRAAFLSVIPTVFDDDMPYISLVNLPGSPKVGCFHGVSFISPWKILWKSQEHQPPNNGGVTAEPQAGGASIDHSHGPPGAGNPTRGAHGEDSQDILGGSSHLLSGVITPVGSGFTLLIPVISGVITHLRSVGWSSK